MGLQVNTRSLKSINVNLLNDAGQTLFMEQHSLLWGGSTNHGFEYIIRGTAMGNEHYFHSSIFNQLIVK